MTQNTLSEEQQRKNDVSIQHYNNIHFWLKYHYGKPTRCEDKKCTGGSKRMEYALKKGKKYEKVRSNYLMLCSRCHKKYDGIGEIVRKNKTGKPISDEFKKWLSDYWRGKPKPYKRVKVRNVTTGEVFDSIKEAAAKHNVAFRSIINVCAGRKETLRNNKWEYV